MRSLWSVGLQATLVALMGSLTLSRSQNMLQKKSQLQTLHSLPSLGVLFMVSQGVLLLSGGKRPCVRAPDVIWACKSPR